MAKAEQCGSHITVNHPHPIFSCSKTTRGLRSPLFTAAVSSFNPASFLSSFCFNNSFHSLTVLVLISDFHSVSLSYVLTVILLSQVVPLWLPCPRRYWASRPDSEAVSSLTTDWCSVRPLMSHATDKLLALRKR